VQHFGISGRVLEIEDGDSTARLQHADKLAKRQIACVAGRDVVNDGHRDDDVERRVGKRQPCDISGLHLDAAGDAFRGGVGQGRFRMIVGQVLRSP
jgi:hypothetical protein